MALENISDQLEPYTQENILIIKKLAKEMDLTIDQTIKCVEISAKEMIADCLFRIQKSIPEELGLIAENILDLKCSNNIDNLVKEIQDIKEKGADKNDNIKSRQENDNKF